MTKVIDQVNSLKSLSQWIQSQQADLAVVAMAERFEAVLQVVDSLPVEDGLSVLLLLEDDWIEIAETESTILSQLMGTGVVSLLPMDVSADEMRNAIAAILSGFNVLHPDISEALFAPSEDTFSAIETDNLEPLTAREIEVLNQLASGATNKAIAKTLIISEHTVKFHISTILSKLDVASRTEAVAVGIRAGLVML